MRLVLIKSDHCGHCLKFKPTFDALVGNFIKQVYDISSQKGQEFIEKYKQEGFVPQTFLLDDNDNLVEGKYIAGNRSLEECKKILGIDDTPSMFTGQFNLLGQRSQSANISSSEDPVEKCKKSKNCDKVFCLDDEGCNSQILSDKTVKQYFKYKGIKTERVNRLDTSVLALRVKSPNDVIKMTKEDTFMSFAVIYKLFPYPPFPLTECASGGLDDLKIIFIKNDTISTENYGLDDLCSKVFKACMMDTQVLKRVDSMKIKPKFFFQDNSENMLHTLLGFDSKKFIVDLENINKVSVIIAKIDKCDDISSNYKVLWALKESQQDSHVELYTDNKSCKCKHFVSINNLTNKFIKEFLA